MYLMGFNLSHLGFQKQNTFSSTFHVTGIEESQIPKKLYGELLYFYATKISTRKTCPTSRSTSGTVAQITAPLGTSLLGREYRKRKGDLKQKLCCEEREEEGKITSASAGMIIIIIHPQQMRQRLSDYTASDNGADRTDHQTGSRTIIYWCPTFNVIPAFQKIFSCEKFANQYKYIILPAGLF